MTVFDTARQLRTPGIVVQAHIDPSLISKRIKKMAQNMLRKGIFTGGWSSKSRQLAIQLIVDLDLPALMVNYWWGARYRSAILDKTQLAHLDELFDADRALQLMAEPTEWQRSTANDATSHNKRRVRDFHPNACAPLHLRIHNDEIREQVHELLLAWRLPADVAALHAIADSLDSTAHIPVTIEL